jgi:hypothetical protein
MLQVQQYFTQSIAVTLFEHQCGLSDQGNLFLFFYSSLNLRRKLLLWRNVYWSLWKLCALDHRVAFKWLFIHTVKLGQKVWLSVFFSAGYDLRENNDESRKVSHNRPETILKWSVGQQEQLSCMTHQTASWRTTQWSISQLWRPQGICSKLAHVTEFQMMDLSLALKKPRVKLGF